jgi:hypothetical protein
MSIETRVRKIEAMLGVKKDEEPLVAIICISHDEAHIPHFPEPVQEWVTFQAAYAEAKRARQPCLTFMPDPYAEYEARHGLEPGRLTGHPMKGQVPFAELLEPVTATGLDTSD